MEKIEVPQFGREEKTTIGGKEYTHVIMESKEGAIIELAEKMNEIIEALNNLKV